MNPVLRFEMLDVTVRLAELGLSAVVLRESVMEGMQARSECTPNDPPLFPGFTTWARTVRCLRERLIPIPFGWNASDEGGYSLVVSPSGKIAIAVAKVLSKHPRDMNTIANSSKAKARFTSRPVSRIATAVLKRLTRSPALSTIELIPRQNLQIRHPTINLVQLRTIVRRLR